MQYRQLGNSPLRVSEISLGSWLTYGVGVERERGIACVHRALDLGINFFDTANIYGKGAAELVMGEALAGIARERYVLATKLYFPMTASDYGLSRAQVIKQLDDSLKRLRTDHVDLYQCHRYDTKTPLEETLEALTMVVKQGKVRYLGFSEWSPRNIRDALAVPHVESFVSSQPQYSLLHRSPEDKVMPLCRENGISQIVWSPLAQGVLTGKYTPDSAPPANTRAASDKMSGFISDLLRPKVLQAVQQLKPLAEQAGTSMTRFALAWILREPNVASAIVGASSAAQLDETAGASGLQIDPKLFAAAETALKKVARF